MKRVLLGRDGRDGIAAEIRPRRMGAEAGRWGAEMIAILPALFIWWQMMIAPEGEE